MKWRCSIWGLANSTTARKWRHQNLTSCSKRSLASNECYKWFSTTGTLCGPTTASTAVHTCKSISRYPRAATFAWLSTFTSTPSPPSSRQYPAAYVSAISTIATRNSTFASRDAPDRAKIPNYCSSSTTESTDLDQPPTKCAASLDAQCSA